MTVRPLPDRHADFSAAPDVATSTVHARGVLDAFSADLLRGAIDMLTAAGRQDVVVDLREVTGIDRRSVRMLAALQHDFSTHHGTLTVAGADDAVLAALRDGQVRVSA